MINEAELRRMSRDERFGLVVILCCCVGLAGWIALLVLTLPGHYTSQDWRAVWVGLDLAELAGFAATGWAAWHQRQVVIFLMIITGTLLVCDAWFDVALDYGSRDFTASVISAVVVELPVAFLLFASARRLVRVTVQLVMQLSGVTGPAPALWRVPLFAAGLDEALPARLRGRADVTADDLRCRPWPPTSPRKQRLTPSSRASPRPRTRGYASC